MPRLVSTAALACAVLGLVCCNVGNLQGTGGPFPTTIYAGTSAGASASQNGGTSWTTLGFAGNAVNGIAAVNSSTSVTIYAATNTGLFETTNGGATWASLLAGAVNGFAVSGTSICAATSNGVWIYNGTGWTNDTLASTSGGIPSNTVQGIFAGANIDAATNGGLSISTDGGNTWTQYTTANTSPALPSNNILAVFDDGTNTYAATDNGLAEAPDGTPTGWTVYNVSNGLPSSLVQGVFASSGQIYAATAAGLSFFNGSAWTT